jgi:hypothetical protein
VVYGESTKLGNATRKRCTSVP